MHRGIQSRRQKDPDRQLGQNGAAMDASTGKELGRMQHGDRVMKAVFSPDGSVALTGGDDKTARLWDVAMATPLGCAAASRQVGQDPGVSTGWQAGPDLRCGTVCTSMGSR